MLLIYRELNIKLTYQCFKNKVFIVERPLPQYKSAYCISGHETGLKTLNTYSGFLGKRLYDEFDFVNWLNNGR